MTAASGVTLLSAAETLRSPQNNERKAHLLIVTRGFVVTMGAWRYGKPSHLGWKLQF